MRLTTLKMPEELIDRLRGESVRTGAPRAEIIRRAIVAYLDGRDRKNGPAEEVFNEAKMDLAPR